MTSRPPDSQTPRPQKSKASLLILGAGGMVGSALVREATTRGYTDILTPSSRDLDLINQADTHAYLADNKPAEVIVAAAKVGGIHANSTYPAEFIYKNLMIPPMPSRVPIRLE